MNEVLLQRPLPLNRFPDVQPGNFAHISLASCSRRGVWEM